MKKLLFAMAIGAALAWLFDPDAGARRRDALKRKLDEKGLTGPASSPPFVPRSVVDYAPSAVASTP
jgi:hypothetical protein